MKATEARLLDFLKRSQQFVIPIYQRTYSWTEQQCRQLWDDIIRAGKRDDISAHFIGSVVYIEQGFDRSKITKSTSIDVNVTRNTSDASKVLFDQTAVITVTYHYDTVLSYPDYVKVLSNVGLSLCNCLGSRICAGVNSGYKAFCSYLFNYHYSD